MMNQSFSESKADISGSLRKSLEQMNGVRRDEEMTASCLRIGKEKRRAVSCDGKIKDDVYSTPANPCAPTTLDKPTNLLFFPFKR